MIEQHNNNSAKEIDPLNFEGCRSESRELYEIYSELGCALLATGKQLEEAEGLTEQARSRYAQSAQAFLEALREKPENAPVQLSLAQARQGQQRFEEAIRAYLEAVRLLPSQAAIILARAHSIFSAESARSLGNWLDTEWRPKIEQVALDNGERAAVFHFLGRAFLYREQYPQALHYFQRANADRPDDPHILEGMGESLWRMGRKEQAAELLNQAISQAAEATPERRAKINLKLVHVLIEYEHYGEAIPLIRQGVLLNEKLFGEFQVALGQCYVALDKARAALQVAELVLADNDKNVGAHVVRADALYALRQYQAAAEAAEAALQLDPSQVSAAYLKARSLLDGELDLEQAIRLLNFYTRQQPDDPTGHRQLLQALRQSGQLQDELAGALERAAANIPSEAGILLEELAQVHLAAGRYSKVMEVLDSIAPSDPVMHSSRWWRLYADAQHQDSQVEAALQSYRRAWELDRNDSELLEKYVDFLTQVKNLPVTEILEELGCSAEKLAKAYFKKAQTYSEKREYEPAEKFFKLARDLNHKEQSTYWYLADTLWVRSYVPTYPYVDKQKLDESRDVWSQGSKISFPSADDSWAYLTRSLINEQQAKLPDTDLCLLWWEAITYIERAIVLNEWDAYRWAILGRYYRNLNFEAGALHLTTKALEYDADNLIALDERAAILANVGDFDEAVKIVDRRLALEPNNWTEAVKVYILLHREKYQSALELINKSIAAEPEFIWFRTLRASCFKKLNEPEKAREEYEWIWRLYRPEANAFDQADFAEVAYNLGVLTNDIAKIDDAIQIYTRLSKNSCRDKFSVSSQLGLCYLCKGDLQAGEPLIDEGIQAAINIRQLNDLAELFDDFLKLDLGVEKFYPDIQKARLLDEAFDRIMKKIAVKKDDLAQKPKPIDEDLRQLIESLEREGKTDSWSWVGAQAGLARQQAEQSNYQDAAATYAVLGQAENRFPEAGVGLENLVAKLQQSGDEQLQEGQYDKAREYFTQAIELSQQRHIGSKITQGDLYSRQGYAYFCLYNASKSRWSFTNRIRQALFGASAESAFSKARRSFVSAIQLYRDSQVTDPGGALGSICRSLLPQDSDSYRPLDDAWNRWASTSGPALRNDLQAARKTLAPPARPIVLEIGSRLAPDQVELPETLERWPLLKSYIPEIRNRIKRDTEVEIPSVHIIDSSSIPPESYRILLDEALIATGSVHLQQGYSPTAAAILASLGIPEGALDEANQPATDLPGCWVQQDYWRLVLRAAYELWDDPLRYTAAHLEAVLRQRGAAAAR